MDSISEATTSLADLAADAVDVDAVMRFGVEADALAGTAPSGAASSMAFATLAASPAPIARVALDGDTLLVVGAGLVAGILVGAGLAVVVGAKTTATLALCAMAVASVAHASLPRRAQDIE